MGKLSKEIQDDFFNTKTEDGDIFLTKNLAIRREKAIALPLCNLRFVLFAANPNDQRQLQKR